MPRPSGIPRLQELAFLLDAMTEAAAGCTFDQVRLAMFDHMEKRRATTTLTGNHAGVRRRGEDDERFGYLHNASEALGELMRLGYLERQPLPSSRATLESHRRRTFVPTDDGLRWSALIAERRFAEAYDELLKKLWAQHPQFVAYLRLLQRAPFVVPTAQWSEAEPDDPQATMGDRRSAFVDYLAARCNRAMGIASLGWSATEDEIRAAIRSYVDDRVAGAASRGRTDPYPRGRDFVGACEEALAKFAFAQAGVRLDYISLEILRRWCRDLGVASFSYHVPIRPALTMWSTATLRETFDGSVTAERRTSDDDTLAVIHGLPEAFGDARKQDRSDFVAIYLVRAAACHKLRLSENVFDRALTRCLADPAAAQGFRVHLDPAQYRPVPPTERPFVHDGRIFYSMTLVTTRDRTPA